MRPRNVVHDNIATESAPVWRARFYTPLTPRAVRNDLSKQSMEIAEARRDDWMAKRLTPLDRLLTEDEAAALERYVHCESILAGAARCADYVGERVQTSRSDMDPLPDKWLAMLAEHNVIKARLTHEARETLRLFCMQMEQNGPSDAECAFWRGLAGRNVRGRWQEAVRAAVGELV